ncbi:MAG TPA: c-type cytochrome domain-containing protein [Thermoguttaceae bacterium]|nr:c-type cytochrome domain-containing protein [Thermoguttaceae bacterium]
MLSWTRIPRWGLAMTFGALLVGGTVQRTRAIAAEEKPQPKITYQEHVRPIFREHCFACHNQNKAGNDLAVDSYERLMQGGASGEIVEPGDLDSSWLWSLITHEDEPAMPLGQDKLPDAKLEVIKQWILGGALKDSRATAPMRKKPAINLFLSAGGAKPEGPAVMPEGLPRQPVVQAPRAGAVTAVASSPWAPLLAVAGQKQIVLYHSESGELLGILPFPEGIPYVLRFSRSGALRLAGGGRAAILGLVVVYDVKPGNRVFQVGDELDSVLAADINENRTLIALGGPQRIVRVFATADGSQQCEIRKHTDRIYAVEFSPDGVLLATADRSGGLWVWEAETGREFHNLQGHKGGVTDVSWRSDSNVLASASEDGTIKLWGMEDGKQLKSINAHGQGVTSIDFTHDGRLVSCGRDRVVKVWDTAGNQQRVFDPFADVALEVAFSHDGNRVVAGDWIGEIRIWNTADGKQVGTLSSNPAPPSTEWQRFQDALGAGVLKQNRPLCQLLPTDSAE